ncbi:TPA: hypothetical protein ACPZMC_002694 [Yersinia enterocolitica]|uniref:Uncharacterized protein n=1 Tax=Yersinia enterocolitica TaxID=630 RepID=A0AAD2UZJ9_YEREN|nr:MULTISPECIES: hypothetical protein [Yersinia]EKN6064367.1 hypothetical protein [Yersinia enterocolitica]ELI8102117.1 hypothetical protein [Yersinia enterocolitica]ELW7390338.1 hypothetical protein [Yersinia enterocolitica]MDN0095679.1 hypothetical protein [Yersinia rohdei]CFB67761.1 Uncharacterised protein [Yersinia enterocolitica]
MKTSTLIKKLIEIDKTVPFDANIVQGDDYEYDDLIKVYHNPPNTYLVFNSQESEHQDIDMEEENISVVDELEIRVHHTETIKHQIISNDLTKDQIILMLDDMINRMSGMVKVI